MTLRPPRKCYLPENIPSGRHMARQKFLGFLPSRGRCGRIIMLTERITEFPVGIQAYYIDIHSRPQYGSDFAHICQGIQAQDDEICAGFTHTTFRGLMGLSTVSADDGLVFRCVG